MSPPFPTNLFVLLWLALAAAQRWHCNNDLFIDCHNVPFQESCLKHLATNPFQSRVRLRQKQRFEQHSRFVWFYNGGS